MFKELEFNCELNGLGDICTLNRVAVSSARGTARLSRYEEGSEVYGSLGTHRWRDAKIVGHEDVETLTLDDYAEENKIVHVDFVKMDIEGAELLALKGAERLLSRTDAPTILVEMADINTDGFGYKASDIWVYPANLGYRMHRICADGKSLREIEQPDDFRVATNIVASKTKRGYA